MIARRALFALLAVLVPLPALAQQADAPLEITADGGLEWRRDEHTLVADRNVVVTRGAMRLQADAVSAYYRDRKGAKEQEVYRVDATGHVRIVNDGVKAAGDSAAYDLDQAVFVLSGSPRLEARNMVVTAAQSLEYWDSKHLAVARGKARAESQGRQIEADVLSAYVEPGPDGNMALRRVEAIGGVVISTAEDRATGEQAVYDATTGVATLCGGVTIRRGDNELRGNCAEIDLNTGVSRLIGGGGGVGGIVRPAQ